MKNYMSWKFWKTRTPSHQNIIDMLEMIIEDNAKHIEENQEFINKHK